MAASGYTPIQLYRTATASAAPSAINLTSGELAINYNAADMALYAKNGSGSVIRLMNNPAGLKYPTADGTNGQVLITDGAGVLSWASSAAGFINGSGTTNYVPKFTSSSAIGNSIIYDDGTNVGIGTSTPASYGKFVIVADSADAIVAAINSSAGASGFSIQETPGTSTLNLITYASTYPGGSYFGVGPRGSALVQGSNAPLGIGTYGVAQPLIFGTNGSERMRIDSSGNVGIGTSSPTVPLTITKASYFPKMGFGRSGIGTWFVGGDNVGTDNDFHININATTNFFTIDTAGNVGIGTSSPDNKLLIETTSSNVIENTLTLRNMGTGNGTGSAIKFGYGDTASNLYGARITAYGYPTTTRPYSIGFERADGAGTGWNQSMVIDQNGNVGINTTSTVTGCRLNVEGGINSSNGGLNVSGNGGFYNAANKFGVDNNAGVSRIYSSGSDSSTRGSYDFRITDSVGTLDTSAMVITSSGRVGIGTTIPNFKLYVDIVDPDRGIVAAVSNGPTTATTGAQLAFHQGGIAYWSIGQPGGVSAFSIWKNRWAGQDGQEVLRIDSSGNVGIGTTSTIGKLTISANGANQNALGFIDTNTTGRNFYLGPGIGTGIVGDFGLYDATASQSAFLYTGGSAGKWVWYTNGTERMRIDSSGNLGLGVTPSAWAASVKGIDINTVGAVISSNNAFELYFNSYWNGSNFIYKTTNVASKYEQSLGAHKWYTAPSGTAGTTISFTQAMTLDASGNLGIGTSLPTTKLDVSGGIRTNEGVLAVGGGFGGDVYLDGYTAPLVATATSDAYYSAFFTNATAGNGYGVGIYVADSGQSTIYMGNGTTTALGVVSYSPSQNNTYYGGITYDNTNGRVGINVSNPAYQLQLQLNSAAKPTSNLWIVASDERIKNITGEYTKGLEAVCALRPITYKYNGKAGFVVDDKENISIIAQEAMVPFPECVSTFKAKLNEDDAETTELYNWDGHALTFALVNAIKEQQVLINQLTDRIAALEGK